MMLYRNSYSKAKSVKQLHRDIFQMVVDNFVMESDPTWENAFYENVVAYQDVCCYCGRVGHSSANCNWRQ